MVRVLVPERVPVPVLVRVLVPVWVPVPGLVRVPVPVPLDHRILSRAPE